MKVALVISSLGAGGAERVLVGIANWLHAHNHEVTVITYLDQPDFYALDSGVTRLKVSAKTQSHNILKRITATSARAIALRAYISSVNPDRVISFVDKCNTLTLIACMGLEYKVIISERTNPKYYQIGVVQSFLRRIFYRRAHALVIQTESLRKWAEHHISDGKIFVIPNALDKNRIADMLNVQPAFFPSTFSLRIITMGRLSYEKGHDLLLEAYATISEKYPDWGLEIIGDGPLRVELELLARKLGIQQKVTFHGQVNNPFGLIKCADIFVFPSRVEGFPNALLEAMGLGVAVASFNCPSGPADLIRHNENGLLVSPQSISDLSLALERLILDEGNRIRLGENARDVVNQYSEENIMYRWNQVLSL